MRPAGRLLKAGPIALLCFVMPQTAMAASAEPASISPLQVLGVFGLLVFALLLRWLRT